MDKPKGFTLIELLVVIAVIALLMSILMPAMSKVKQQTKKVMCRSNLRQWGIIFNIYLNDHDGKFMSGHEWEELLPGGSGWDDEDAVDQTGDHAWPLILLRYYKAPKLLCCPAATKPPFDHEGKRVRTDHVFSTWGLWWQHPQKYFYGSYGINRWTYNRREGQDQVNYWKRLEMRGAHAVPLFGDCRWYGGGPLHFDLPPEFPGQDTVTHWRDNNMRRFGLDRHVGKMCLAFVDYSVRTVDLKELWTLRWHINYDRRGPWTRTGGVLPEDWPDWMRGLKDY